MSAPRGRRRVSLVAVAVLAALSAPVIGRAFEIDWFTIDGGGGHSIAGSLALNGTIAQPDAGALTGGTLAVRGGFWAAAGITATGVEETPGAALVPASFQLSAGAPNPFRGRTAIRFDLPRDARATIRVYDVTGRLVRTLVDDALPGGRHSATWDGADRGGSRVASGVYLVRMQADDFGATRKIVRLD